MEKRALRSDYCWRAGTGPWQATGGRIRRRHSQTTSDMYFCGLLREKGVARNKGWTMEDQMGRQRHIPTGSSDT